MQKRKDSLSVLKICRFCLCQDVELNSLYDKPRVPKNSLSLSFKILSCLSVEVFPSDKMPGYICTRCKFFMELFYDYKQICRQTDETIMQYIQNGTALELAKWPQALTKLFQLSSKVSEPKVVETIVEGGATIQVTSQDASDSDEEEDENVYNVKIGEGTEESTCIKVVTSKDENENSDEPKTKGNKGFSSLTKLTRHVRTHAGERAYPCKFCNKSFMKSHHYTRHVRVKHGQMLRSSRTFGSPDPYRCDQCDVLFPTQDDLIYHSAIHATQNLICPLCQEKFENVDDVTAHIKSHVNGVEFMCDLCELVFTTKEKLDNHLRSAHEDELQENEELVQDESSMDMDAEEDDDDNGLNVKEEDGEMVVEINKPSGYLLPNTQNGSDMKQDNTNSEESDSETTYAELATVETIAIAKSDVPQKKATVSAKSSSIKIENDGQPANILRKAEEVKRKVVQQSTDTEKKQKSGGKAENSSAGVSEKSLRLLEKELQELKRTNTRSEVVKTPVKSLEVTRTRRPQLHTSTPKPKVVEEKKPQTTKTATIEKKIPERRIVTKENKEPKEVKNNTSNNNGKDEKVIKEEKPTVVPKEEKPVIDKGEKDLKEKDTPKATSDEGVRRSTRPSKIKDYAKMIRDRSQMDSDDDSDDKDDEEYRDVELENRNKQRRTSIKTTPKTTPVAATTPTVVRKRGRPRKEAPAIPPKLKKDEKEESESSETNEKTDSESVKSKEHTPPATPVSADVNQKKPQTVNETNVSPNTEPNKPPSGVLVSPTGQTLKKVPIKALPPGVKPLPLPLNARPMGAGELCEMQIGKKVVKVQKIVMTKAEVEAMAKKGLVEMKDGTMVLKQGIKLPNKTDPASIKSSLVGEDVTKESPIKKDKPAPSRCDLED